MKKISIVVAAFGIITLLGGVFGYVKAQSLPSLWAGCGFGISLLLCGWGCWKEKKIFATLAIVLTLLLDGFFTYRFLRTFSLFPAGFMALLSLIVLGIEVLLLRSEKCVRRH